MTDTDDDLRDRVQGCMDRIEEGFHRKWDEDPSFREDLDGKDRDIVIDVPDAGAWTIVVRDGKLRDIEQQPRDDPDVTVTAEGEDFLAVFDGDLSPLEAYMKNKIEVDAGLGDLLLVKSFLG